MASLTGIVTCGLVAVFIYTIIGLPMAQRVAPRALAPMLAPAFGWAVHSAVALPIMFAVGLSRPAVFVVYAVPLLAAGWLSWRDRAPLVALPRPQVIAMAGAVLLALVVMAVLVPKFSPDGVTLAAPIFDHSKIAMIDEMTRLGVPPGNPFYGGDGSPARLSYYYLWHFSAAELSILLGLSGWAADGGLSLFTGIASLAVLIGLAVWLSGRTTAALWVVALAATGSLRPLLNAAFGVDPVSMVVGYRSGFGGWLFQTSWAPQHTASAVVALLSIYLLVELARRPSALIALLLGLCMAAGFESSTWIGGITFPLAAMPIAVTLLARAAPRDRLRVTLCLAGAALLALLLISPLLYDQMTMSALRGDGPPVAIRPNSVLDDSVFDWLGDNIAYGVAVFVNGLAQWLIYLPVEFPAFYITGLIAFVVLLKDRALSPARRVMTIAAAMATAASLIASWLLVSTLGENNDLGWRAVLPGMMLLMVVAAAGLSRLSLRPLSPLAVIAVVPILLGLPDAAMFGYGNVVVKPLPKSRAFAASPALWQAVRKVTPPNERVANNPGYMDSMTPWPVNISWALLADRRSCFAGPALVGPFSALSKARGGAIDALFTRVFDGKAEAGDVDQLATQFHCATAVVAPADGAWRNDPFATSSLYRLVDGTPDWRIYRIVRNP